MNLPGHQRYPYRPITDRPNYTWPGDARLAVYIGLNLEHFAFGSGLGAELAPGGPQPDILNFAWRDYGNRVGAWRLLELFDDLEIPSSVLINSSLYDYCPELVAAFRRRGDEIVGHGRTNSERQSLLSEAEEAVLIREASEAICKHEGKSAAGWLGPWIAESRATPDLLKEAGYRYVLDWCHDDQPTWLTTRAGPLLSLPYPQELNDIPAIAVRRTDAAVFANMIVDNFDEMKQQAQNQPLVMGIALHAYIIGQPFRLRHLRRALRHIVQSREGVWIATAGHIADHFIGLGLE